MIERDLCENCNLEVPVEDLKESRDPSDGNMYLHCHSCRQKHNALFQQELEESYAEETEALFAYGNGGKGYTTK